MVKVVKIYLSDGYNHTYPLEITNIILAEQVISVKVSETKTINYPLSHVRKYEIIEE